MRGSGPLSPRRLVVVGAVRPPLAVAESVGAQVRAVPVRSGDAADDAADAVRAGVAAADAAVDEGVAVLLGAGGASAGAAAVICALNGAEPVAAIPRTDDATWSRWVVEVRDALRRSGGVREPLAVVSDLGGPEVGVLAGLVVGAAARRTPVVLDGEVAAAAALVVSLWCPAALSYVLAGHRTHTTALRELGLEPLLDLGLRAGDGTGALLALPLLDAALAVRERVVLPDL